MKRAGIFVRCISFVLLACLGIRIASASGYNNYLNETFEPKETDGVSYDKAVPLEDMDLQFYRERYLGSRNGSTPLTNLYVTITADVPYYSSPDSTGTPAFVLSPGMYYFDLGSCDFGEGSLTLPTYHRGWRYGKIPPLAPNNASIETSPHWFYIKLEDLHKIRYQYLFQNELKAFNMIFTKGASCSTFLRSWNIIWRNTDLLVVDRLMFEKGDYLSPDLFKPLWDWKCTVLATGAILLFVLERLLSRQKKRFPTISQKYN